MTALASATLILTGLAATASAEEAAPRGSEGWPADPRPATEHETASVARGLIVQTTTSVPADGVIDSVDAALGAAADVADDKKLTGKISTISFDQEVNAELASEAASELEERADVVWAAPDTLRQRQSKPPGYPNYSYSSQWNLWDVKHATGGYTVKAPALWKRTGGSSDIRVAVLDTGISPSPSLAGQQVPGYDMIGADDPKAKVKSYFTANDGDGRDEDASDPGDWVRKGQCYKNSRPENSSWHGTFVAGQIASNAHQSGVSGIAYSSKVQSVRVLGRCGGWDSDILAGITWASGGKVAGVPDNQYPSQVVNLSLGYTYAKGADRNRACKSYAAAAAAGRARGSIFVAAAGNDGSNANLAVPASCPGYISVGALGRQGFSATYSNIGTSVDLSAPGGDTLVGGESELIPSIGRRSKTTPENAWANMKYEGTSMAAPQVSAGAALLLDTLRRPEISDQGPSQAAEVTASRLEAAVLSSVSPFRKKSAAWARKKVSSGGRTYSFDLNCSGHRWCGRGLFDLTRAQVPISPPNILSGQPVVNEQMAADSGTWLGNPKFRYQWFRISSDWTEVVPVGSGKLNYTPTREDVGSRLRLKVSPAAGLYTTTAGWTSVSSLVIEGATVTMSVPAQQIVFGTPFTTSVTVSGREGGGPGAENPHDANVAVFADGVRLTDWVELVGGKADLTIPGDNWPVGTFTLSTSYGGMYDSDTQTHLSYRSASAPQTVTVVRATPTVTTSLASKVRRTSRAKLTLDVTVPNVSGPAGTLRVYDGSRVIANSYLYASSNGKKTVSLPRLAKGTHKIRVYYGGTSNINAKYSAYEAIVSK